MPEFATIGASFYSAPMIGDTSGWFSRVDRAGSRP